MENEIIKNMVLNVYELYSKTLTAAKGYNAIYLTSIGYQALITELRTYYIQLTTLINVCNVLGIKLPENIKVEE